MDRNEIEYNEYKQEKETERLLKRRERERYSEELSELEHSLASARNGIFWAAVNLLVIEPIITFATWWYFWGEFKKLVAAHATNP